MITIFMLCSVLYITAGAETESHTLLFKLNDDDSRCDLVEPTLNLTIKESSILTAKVFSKFVTKPYKFWCEKFDKNNISDNKALPALLSSVSDRNGSFAIVTIEVETSHYGEFDCFVAKDEKTTFENKMYNTYKKLCQAKLNIVGSTSSNLLALNPEAPTQQTTTPKGEGSKNKTDTTRETPPRNNLNTPSEPKTDSINSKASNLPAPNSNNNNSAVNLLNPNPKIRTQQMAETTSVKERQRMIWIIVGLGMVILGLVAAVIYLYRKHRARNFVSIEAVHV